MQLILEKIKKVDIVRFIFSVLFTTMFVFSRHCIVDPYAEDRTIENTYFTDLSFIDFIFFIMLFTMIYIIVSKLKMLKKEYFYEEPRQDKGFIQLAISFIVIALCYIPYLMSSWPGGVYSDTMNSLWIATGTDPMTTHEPIGYTLLWKLMFAVAGGSLEPGDYGAIYMFTIVQSMGMALMLALFTNWCYKRGMKKSVVTVLTIIFALFPLFPYYGISLWKDTVFGIIIFLFSWFLYCMFERIANTGEVKTKDVIIYAILLVCVAFFRNNGIYVAIFVSVVIALMNIKIRKVLLKVGITSAVVIIVSLIIQHPVFNALEYNVDTAIESLAVPLQQTAYIVCTDGKVTEEEAEFINNIMPYEHWVEVYCPIISDFIKFNEQFDRGYFNDNVGRFFKTYLHLCIKNPVKAVKGYVLATSGFWDLFKDSSNAYICCDSIAWTGIFQGDFYAYKIGMSFRELVYPKHYISAATWVWLMLLVLTIAISYKKKKSIIAIIPALGVWITIMLAVPIAFSFRYIFGVFLCVPVYFICMIDDEKRV